MLVLTVRIGDDRHNMILKGSGGNMNRFEFKIKILNLS